MTSDVSDIDPRCEILNTSAMSEISQHVNMSEISCEFSDATRRRQETFTGLPTSSEIDDVSNNASVSQHDDVEIIDISVICDVETVEHR